MNTILVVDDEIEICDFLKTFFEERDYRVAVALNGTEALRKVESLRPQVVLLDIQMPCMGGLEVLKEIKAKYPDIKVIMVTAIETQDKLDEAMRLGASNYITKPLSLEYLEKDVQEKIQRLTEVH